MTCLVLDLNGVLWHKLKGKNVRYYPNVEDFLFLANVYFDKIAFYSSTTAENAFPVLRKLLQKTKIEPLFIWTRAQTEIHPTIGGFATYKPIRKIKELFPDYHFILVDDEVNKMYGNDPSMYYITTSPPNYLKMLRKLIEMKDALTLVTALDKLTLK